MAMTTSSVERARLEEIAEEYKQRGYRVTIAPPSKRLPRFLGKFRPDMVAEGPNESVVIEIKSSPKVRGLTYWKELSDAVHRHPGWRLELVVQNPLRPRTPQTIDTEVVQERLKEGQQLSDQGMLAAALLITWSAAEAAMRSVTKDYEIDLPDLRPTTVISRLYTDGVLEREEYDFLVRCMHSRNAVAHGFNDEKITLASIKRLGLIALRLLSGASR